MFYCLIIHFSQHPPDSRWRLSIPDNRCLEQYPYRVSVGAGVYVVLSGITILLVLLTVFRQVIKAANENPADVVKSE